jgi:hypothetical protein
MFCQGTHIVDVKTKYKKTEAQGSGYQVITHVYCCGFHPVNGETGHELTAVILQLRLKLGTRTKATTAAGVERQLTVDSAGSAAHRSADTLAAIVRVQARRRRDSACVYG